MNSETLYLLARLNAWSFVIALALMIRLARMGNDGLASLFAIVAACNLMCVIHYWRKVR